MPRRRPIVDRAEQRAVAGDMAAQERGDGRLRTPRRARGYVHTTHPGHGEAVVFKPGEVIPDWAPENDEEA